jgi:hypothetical protein
MFLAMCHISCYQDLIAHRIHYLHYFLIEEVQRYTTPVSLFEDERIHDTAADDGDLTRANN